MAGAVAATLSVAALRGVHEIPEERGGSQGCRPADLSQSGHLLVVTAGDLFQVLDLHGGQKPLPDAAQGAKRFCDQVTG
mgnify:CR=1 FL=1